MKFTKMQGTGNDFVLVDARGMEQDWPKLAQVMCHRHFGVGADGVILVLPSQVANFRMRIFNADGSEAEMCGNGIRCFARYVVEQGLWPTNRGELSVETLAGVKQLTLVTEGGSVRRVRVGMGRPLFSAADIPMLVEGRGELDINPILEYPIAVEERQLRVTCLSMGNPHAIYFLEEPVEGFPLNRVGPQVEHHPVFPKRVNFEVVNKVGPDQLRMRVWERGVGETLACGTGACAAAVAARLHGLVGDAVEVALPGGVLRIEWDGIGEVFLSGSAETVFTGEWVK